ncbi:MAG: ATP-binding protein [Oligoflexales bacterium]
MKILILDDQKYYLESLVDGLNDLNIEIQTTTDPKKALKLVKQHSQDYAVLLIDINMPIMNGFEVIQKINNLSLEYYPPAIFLTAVHNNQQNIHYGYSNGAVDYLLKPVDLFILQSKISIFTKLYKSRNENNLLNQQLSQKISELENANKNLRSFSSVVANDLKTHVRQIYSFSEIMLNKNLKKECSLDYLSRIQQCTSQIKRIIHSISIFSQYGLENIDKKTSHSEEVIQEGKKFIQKEINKFDVEINISNHSYLYCDKEKMSIVFQNIIQNAIKYKNPKNSPVININIQQEPKKTTISFTDNGLGIPENKTKEIFKFMERFHNPEKIPGSGTGLTICEHIVSMHGGHIWVESELNHGSTFFITLPKHQENILLDSKKPSSKID